ncbi:DUF2507 domain-containing protein [Evansella sp. AB-P1]|uniref:DUF2507 domain-containing protein n=1 Tax=Evansella sp. AB-P1 TaxID=3037653 RepID=UPI00241F51D6|nr:DUF2507 domain-containing protein [Evansella sp. AB-P1]MDG5786924.1 DUF2507 domain-containing protein [Evansella sp. AB-P1]
MKNKKQWIDTVEEMNVDVSAFSNHLLRHVLLPELLGEEEESLLYWAGKSIARKVNVENFEDLPAFFEKANWGQLTLVKEKRNERIFELISPLMHHNRPFTLECGFLACWTEMNEGFITEATSELKKKNPCTCRIIVRWDLKDSLIQE